MIRQYKLSLSKRKPLDAEEPLSLSGPMRL